MEIVITDGNLEAYKSGELSLIADLWVTRCGPCKMINPITPELTEGYDGKIIVDRCDVEENDNMVVDLGVRNISTILFFKDGQLVSKFVGTASENALRERFDALL